MKTSTLGHDARSCGIGTGLRRRPAIDCAYASSNIAQAYSSDASRMPLRTASKDQSEDSVVPRRHQRYRLVVATESSTSERVASRPCERPRISAATTSEPARANCVRRSSGVRTNSVMQSPAKMAARVRGMSLDPRMPFGGPPPRVELLRQGVQIRHHLRGRREIADGAVLEE